MNKSSLMLMAGLIGFSAVGKNAWQVARPVIAKVDETSVVSVQLDYGVYAASLPGLTDLRIRDNRGNDVPYIIQKGKKPVTSGSQLHYTLEVKSKTENDGVLVLDTSMKYNSSGTFVTEQITFLSKYDLADRQLEVLSPDGVSLVKAKLVRTEPGWFRVQIPPSGHKRYIIRIDKVEEKQRSATVQVEDTVVNGEVKSQVKRYTVTDRPFEFHDIIAEGTLTTTSFVQVQPTLVRLPLAAASKDNRFTLASKQAPISGLKILASDQNFDRAVKISADRQLIASSHISAINLPGKKSDNRAVMFRETRAENLEVEIDSNGHSPLNIDPDHPADAYMDSYFVCFIAEPGSSYELQTCNPYATGKVKYERLIEQYLNEGHCAVQGALAPATGITFAPRPWSMPNFWSRNGITVISLVIMAILAAVCFSTFKKFGAAQNND